VIAFCVSFSGHFGAFVEVENEGDDKDVVEVGGEMSVEVEGEAAVVVDDVLVVVVDGVLVWAYALLSIVSFGRLLR